MYTDTSHTYEATSRSDVKSVFDRVVNRNVHYLIPMWCSSIEESDSRYVNSRTGHIFLLHVFHDVMNVVDCAIDPKLKENKKVKEVTIQYL